MSGKLPTQWVDAEYARQLERERNELEQTVARLREPLDDDALIRVLRDLKVRDALWSELTSEKGPYSITVPNATYKSLAVALKKEPG